MKNSHFQEISVQQLHLTPAGAQVVFCCLKTHERLSKPLQQDDLVSFQKQHVPAEHSNQNAQRCITAFTQPSDSEK